MTSQNVYTLRRYHTKKEFKLIKLNHKRKYVRNALAMAISCLSLSTMTHAGAFSLFGEGNGFNAGDFGAGVAAEARDASTLNYNPAGLARLKGEQVVVALTGVDVNGKFTGTSTWTSPAFPGAFTQTANGLQGGRFNLVPAIYYARKITERMGVGIGVYVPFGLETNWDPGAATRYAATKSALHVINITPGLGAKVTEKLSAGFAFDFQYAKVDISSVAGIPLAPGVPGPTSLDSTSSNRGNSLGFGAHGGLILETDEHTRFGLTYYTRVRHRFEGKSTLRGRLADPGGFANPAAVATTNNLFSDPATFPAHTVVSGYHDVNSKFAVMGTASYIQWNVFNRLVMNNVMGVGGVPIPRVTVPENFKNTWRFAGGVKYIYNDKVNVRAGVGYDQTPVRDVDRNLRLPDGSRFALAIGGHYQATKTVGVDVGWTHLFMKQAGINNNTAVAATNTLVVGNVKGSANLFGAQLTWDIA